MENNHTILDLTEQQKSLVRATSGKRFLNYIIDLISFYLFIFVVSAIIAFLNPSFVEFLSNNSTGFQLADRVFSLFLYGAYMSIVEAIFKGKTLGKLITRTRAVNLDGSTITASTAFGRGFSRAVPFCAFSALGTPCDPWQDKWTNTMVMDEKESN
jgi:uncharacterized RDD family membrane protein YckC